MLTPLGRLSHILALTLVFLVQSARSISDTPASQKISFVAPKMTFGPQLDSAVHKLQDIIGTDAGGRGMKSLIVPGDLLVASEALAKLQDGSNVIILSGFPCCVNESPPTETDGPPGALALARAAVQLGHTTTLITDDCNKLVFAAAMEGLEWNQEGKLTLETFSSSLSKDEEARLDELAKSCDLLLACERAGPAVDGNCYTMRGINMTEKGLIAPIHRLVENRKCQFLAIGDGGNELGMGKVYKNIVDNPKIADGEKIGCSVAADSLVAASVSNWGGYALAAGAALMKAKLEGNVKSVLSKEILKDWINKCVPTEQEEISLLQRCVDVGCRDGVSGKVEATVDGMPLETSMQCLRDIREASLEALDNA